jgi:hypothetical protein
MLGGDTLHGDAVTRLREGMIASPDDAPARGTRREQDFVRTISNAFWGM